MSKEGKQTAKLKLLANSVDKIFNDVINKAFNKMYNDSINKQQGQGLKIMTRKQMISRLPTLLAQKKAGNNSQRLKRKIRQIIYYFYRSKNLPKKNYNLIKNI